MRIFYITFLAILIFSNLNHPQWIEQKHNLKDNSNMVHIQAYPMFTPADIKSADEAVKLRIHEFIKSQIEKMTIDQIDTTSDVIVFLTDANGEPILTDAENQQKNIVSDMLPNELTFTFNSSAYPWTKVEIDSMKAMLKTFYNLAKIIYGNPAFNISVNIRKNPSNSSSGTYYVSTNEIVLRSLNSVDPLCHEMLHAFRDDYLIYFRNYEEGMTRAAEVEIFNRLDNYPHWDKHHAYDYDAFYDGFNKPAIAVRNGNIYTNATLQLTRYQISSYIWAKCLLEDQDFLKNFNLIYYSQMHLDKSVDNTESKLKSIIESIKPTVENEPIGTWYAKQHILNSNPPSGYKIFQRINQFTIDYFYRSPTGRETPQSANMEWFTYNHKNTLLNEGNVLTNSKGWSWIDPKLPVDYYGRVKLICRTNSPEGIVSDTSNYYIGAPVGIFGVINDLDSCRIIATALDTLVPISTAIVKNGAFTMPSMEKYRGRFKITVEYPGSKNMQRIITKDASRYFLSLCKENMIPAADEHLVCPDGMISYWKLDEISGSTFRDQMGKNDITVNPSSTPIQGKVNGGQHFNAGTTIITNDVSKLFNYGFNNDYSIEFWLSRSGNSSGEFSDYLKIIQDGLWHHLAITQNESYKNIKLYIDGAENNTIVNSLTSLNLNVNWQSTILSYLFECDLDEVAVYDVVLSASIIQDHYNKGIRGEGYCDADSINLSPVITEVEKDLVIPSDYKLYQNYPNPFNPITSIKFSIPAQNMVRIVVYNQLGQEVTELICNLYPEGTYEVQFNAEDIPSGVYYYRMESGKFTTVKKLILLK